MADFRSKLVVWSYLALFSMIGCMIRIVCKQAFIAKHTDSVEEVFPDVIANMFGWCGRTTNNLRKTQLF